MFSKNSATYYRLCRCREVTIALCALNYQYITIPLDFISQSSPTVLESEYVKSTHKIIQYLSFPLPQQLNFKKTMFVCIGNTKSLLKNLSTLNATEEHNYLLIFLTPKRCQQDLLTIVLRSMVTMQKQKGKQFKKPLEKSL